VSLQCAEGRVLDGWALNVSRGGVRVILEEKVEPGANFTVRISQLGNAGDEPPALPQRGCVVWVQEEPDGVVAGIEFRPEADTALKS
jgi:hypothetical protein